MSNTKELTIILEERYSPSDIVELLDGFSKEDLDEYALDNRVCPRCFSELKVHTWNESRGEQFGFPTEEEMSELRCEGCGDVY